MSESVKSAPATTGERRARRWAALVAIAFAVGLVIVDITIVNVALPVIVTDLGVDSTAAQWIQEGYTLALAGLLLPAGRLADIVGRRRLLLLGLGVFMVGSVVAALAPTGAALIGARVLQGVGGAAVLPATLSLLNATFTGAERAMAFAVWGSTIGAVAAIGPLIGGWITDTLSWHWVFWANVLVGLLTAAAVRVFAGESRSADGQRGLDPVGVGLSALSFVGLVFGLIEGRSQGWWTALDPARAVLLGLSPVPLVFAASAVTAAGFIGWQLHRRRRGRPVLLDLSLFAVPVFAQGNVVVLVVALGQLGLLFVLPLWLQNVLGFTALGSGLMITAVALGAFLAAGATPPLAQRWGAAGVLRLGLTAEILALGVLALSAGPDTSTWIIVPLLVLYGFGVGTVDAQLPSLLLAAVPVAQSGQAAGVQSTAQEVGSAIGVAVLGTVLFTTLEGHLGSRLAEAGLPPTVADGLAAQLVTSAGTTIPGLTDPAVLAAAESAFSAATRDSILCGTAFLVLGLATTALFRARPEPPDRSHS